jgi:hypothetical protein
MGKRTDGAAPPVLFSPGFSNGAGAPRLRRALFIPAYLAEIAKARAHVYGDELQRAHAILVKWANLADKGALARKETSLDAEFLHEVFADALGYAPVTQTSPAYKLERNFTVPGVGPADGALGDFKTGTETPPVAIIELKSADTDLDRDRSAGRTPVQQCWDYLNGLPECPWGILSNFVTFRLYHRAHGTRAYQEFLLAELRSLERFARFYHLLGPGGLLPTRADPTPRAVALLQRTGERQREVGDELYDAYSTHRLELIGYLHTKLGRPLEAAIGIAQKLLDRIVFVAFCEDRGLLPRKVIDRTWREVGALTRVTNPRWQNFLNLFHAVDQGHREFELETGYNGGLFAHDPDVDDLQLDDSWTDFFRSIGTYDFRDEVNVDVLGHLFEKSVTELEKIRTGGLVGNGASAPAVGSPSEAGVSAGPTMPKSAERKRFGIYYTPPEFTGFIVEHTIGALVEERFAALARRHGLPADHPVRDQPPAKILAFRKDCLAVLRDVKVCDPACGSGAFLIRAYDCLEEQYTEVIDELGAGGDRAAARLADQIPDLILADNLFGVDVSPEAVEITQLALWIRSARRGHTLANLSRNIVCGNSLVDDPAVHPRAMNWPATFPAVFSVAQPPSAETCAQPGAAVPHAGFDCVIGNPPWERLKVQEREFFSLSAPDIAGAVNAADRRRMIAALQKQNPDLYACYIAAQESAQRTLDYARQSGRYPLTGKGDINTYVLFAELARSLVAPTGRVGLLVPSGIATDASTKEFFAALMDEQALISLYDFENRLGIFPDVHRSFKFSALVFGGSGARCAAADFVFFAHSMDDLRERRRHIALSAGDMALVNPNTRTCPVFRSRRDADLTRAIYRRIPVLVDESRREGGNPWGVRFVTMFHQTNDAELFHTADQLQKLGFKLHGNAWKLRKRVFLPLYEAKMVQAYDHRAAGVLVEADNWVRQGQTDETSLVAHQNPEFVVQPRWWVEGARVDEALGTGALPAYLAYKDVTSPTNERTMIAAFIPRAAVVNSAPLVLIVNGVDWRRRCCLLANLNSFALDFVARQKVGGVHLNFFIVEQLPILAPDAYAERCPWNPRQTLERWISERVLELTCTANDMLPLAEAADFKEGVHKWKPDERAQLKAELDAAYFHLYGLSRDDVEYILSTFAGTARRDVAETGGYRTAQLVLSAYDDLAARR